MPNLTGIPAYGLKRATTTALKTAEFETDVALKGMSQGGIAYFGISAGQQPVLKLAMEAMGNQNFKPASLGIGAAAEKNCEDTETPVTPREEAKNMEADKRPAVIDESQKVILDAAEQFDWRQVEYEFRWSETCSHLEDVVSIWRPLSLAGGAGRNPGNGSKRRNTRPRQRIYFKGSETRLQNKEDGFHWCRGLSQESPIGQL